MNHNKIKSNEININRRQNSNMSEISGNSTTGYEIGQSKEILKNINKKNNNKENNNDLNFNNINKHQKILKIKNVYNEFI